jgi:predicted nucleic acid-binding protein
MALLVGDDQVIAPDLVTLEVASALSKKVRYFALPEAMARRSIAGLSQFIDEMIATDPLLDAAFALSLHLSHAVQDCVYLALAIERDCVLATVDLKFAARVRDASLESRIMVLPD